MLLLLPAATQCTPTHPVASRLSSRSCFRLPPHQPLDSPCTTHLLAHSLPLLVLLLRVLRVLLLLLSLTQNAAQLPCQALHPQATKTPCTTHH